MKTILIIVVILVAGYFTWKVIQTKPDSSTPQAVVVDDSVAGGQLPIGAGSEATDTPAEGQIRSVSNDSVSVSFKGFGPGKEHSGTFSDVRSNLVFSPSGSLVGTVIVGMASLNTDTDGVTNHLKTDAFFDVAKYPTATFKLVNLVGQDAQSATASGSFTIHGVTKAISFPVTFSKDSNSYTAKFTLDMKNFGINQTFANETIELSVVVPLK